MRDKQTCDAHDILVEHGLYLRNIIDEVHLNIRKNNEKNSSMETEIEVLKVKMNSLETKVDDGFKDNKEVQQEILKKINALPPRKVWTPRTIALLIGTIMGGGSIYGFILDLLKR